MKRKNFIKLLTAQSIVSGYRSQAPLGFDPQNAATVLDAFDNELAQVQPPNYSPLKPNQMGGRVRICFFTYTFASQAAGFDLGLAVLPKGARLIDGVFQFSATLGGTTTVSFGLMGKDGSGTIDGSGTSDGVALLMAALASSSTAKQNFLATAALDYGYETQKDLYLTLTTAAGAMGTQVLTGHVTYVVD